MDHLPKGPGSNRFTFWDLDQKWGSQNGEAKRSFQIDSPWTTENGRSVCPRCNHNFRLLTHKQGFILGNRLKHISSSDEFLLNPTRETNTYSFQQMEVGGFMHGRIPKNKTFQNFSQGNGMRSQPAASKMGQSAWQSPTSRRGPRNRNT